MSFLLQSTIQDLFDVDVSENDASRRMAEVVDKEQASRPSAQLIFFRIRFNDDIVSGTIYMSFDEVLGDS